jgi:hypothetical protein
MRRSSPAVTGHCDPVSGVYRPPTCGVGSVNSAAHRWAGKSSRVALTLEASARREHGRGRRFAGYRELRHDVRFRHADGRQVATTAIAHQPSEGIPRLDVDASAAQALVGQSGFSTLTVASAIVEVHHLYLDVPSDLQDQIETAASAAGVKVAPWLHHMVRQISIEDFPPAGRRRHHASAPTIPVPIPSASCCDWMTSQRPSCSDSSRRLAPQKPTSSATLSPRQRPRIFPRAAR